MRSIELESPAAAKRTGAAQLQLGRRCAQLVRVLDLVKLSEYWASAPVGPSPTGAIPSSGSSWLSILCCASSLSTDRLGECSENISIAPVTSPFSSVMGATRIWIGTRCPCLWCR